MKAPTDHLSATLSALADPTRRAILARLASGEASVTELAEPFDMSMPAISKHLKVLERAGLIARGREAQWRPCRLEAAPLKDIADWLEQMPCDKPCAAHQVHGHAGWPHTVSGHLPA